MKVYGGLRSFQAMQRLFTLQAISMLFLITAKSQTRYSRPQSKISFLARLHEQVLIFVYRRIGKTIRKLSHEKSIWKTRRFSFYACVACYECVKQKRRHSVHLCLSRRTRTFLASMLIFHDSIFERLSLASVESCLCDRGPQSMPGRICKIMYYFISHFLRLGKKLLKNAQRQVYDTSLQMAAHTYQR